MSLIITMRTSAGQRFLCSDTQSVNSHGYTSEVGEKMSFVGGALVGSVGAVSSIQQVSMMGFENDLRMGDDRFAIENIRDVSTFGTMLLKHQRDRFVVEPDSGELMSGAIVCVGSSAFKLSERLDVIDISDRPFHAIGTAYEYALGYLQAYLEQKGETDWSNTLNIICQTISKVSSINAYVGKTMRGYAFDGGEWKSVSSGSVS